MGHQNRFAESIFVPKSMLPRFGEAPLDALG